MKERYITPEIAVVELPLCDIVTTSNENELPFEPASLEW